MPYCPRCGSPVANDDNFCRACGRNLNDGNVYSSGKTAQPLPYGDTIQYVSSDGKESSNVRDVKAKSAKEPKEYEYGRYGPSAFPRNILTSKEIPLLETRPLLWINMLGPAVWLMLTCAIFILMYVSLRKAPVLYVMGFFLLCEFLWIYVKWLQWKYIIYAATNRRILYQNGIFNKSYVDCPLSKVQTVYLDVTFIGRLNDFGTIRIDTAGEDGVEIEWRDVKSPTKTQRILYEIMEKYQNTSVQ